MPVLIAQASIDERGKITGGQAGNQSGTELNIRNLSHKVGNPWKVFRAKDPAIAEKIAQQAEAAVANLHIGYDQWERNSLYTAVKAVGYDIARVTKNVETDCSALCGTVAVCAGVPAAPLYSGSNMPATSNFYAKFSATGYFHYLGQIPEEQMKRGDLLYRDGHAVIVLEGTNSGKTPTPTTTDDNITALATAVIAGRYGSGEARKAALGSNYAAVQKRVNELLSGTPNAVGTSTGSARIIAGRYKVLASKLNVRATPSIHGEKVAEYKRGEYINAINPDIVEADGYTWASYKGASGNTRYVALGTSNGREKYLAKA